MLTRRTFLAAAATIPAATALTTLPAFARKDAYFNKGGVAINGYDPVGYFTMSRPVKGDAAHALDWDGTTWHFASAENKAMFEANPAQYAPQYGGYCAYSVSKGYTAKTEPDAWTVHEDKLYLNFDTGVRRIWARDIPGNVSAADANWPGVLA